MKPIVHHVEEKGAGLSGHGHNGFFNAYSTLNKLHFSLMNKNPEVASKSLGYDVSKANYTPKKQKEFQSHLEKAAKLHDSVEDKTYDVANRHKISLKMYMNSAAKTGEKPSTKGYEAYMGMRHQKEVEKAENNKERQLKLEAASQKMSNIHNDRKHLDKIIDIHHHLQNAKNVLTSALGVDKMPDGLVIKDDSGDSVKFYNRNPEGSQNA